MSGDFLNTVPISAYWRLLNASMTSVKLNKTSIINEKCSRNGCFGNSQVLIPYNYRKRSTSADFCLFKYG